jgi:hypothetical protein
MILNFVLILCAIVIIIAIPEMCRNIELLNINRELENEIKKLKLDINELEEKLQDEKRKNDILN